MDFSLSVTQQAVLAMETLRATTASPLTSRPFSSSSFHPPRLHLTPSSHPSSFPGSLSLVRAQNGGGFETKSLSGVIFEPFVEAQNHLVKVASTSSESFARQNYSTSSEAAINDQINIEYTVSYVYHSLFAYFDRDYVGLPGFARFFKKSSDEERHHAEKLIRYQNLRGGKVRLQSIMAPGVSEFDHTEKGDALYAMEVSLALEKLVNEKLLRLHKVAIDNNDPQMQDFVESEFLHSQVEDIKKISTYVSQLRRVGKGHGVYHFDSKLQEENEGEAAVDGMLVANGAAA